ncbi:MAG TPA: hypothetical protein ENJ08_00570 [Gammaproteobacteria bacterium]|nr:hypothetical protein [Gammaproteobacteria bacterium]
MKIFFKVLVWIAGGLIALVVISISGFWWFLDYSAGMMCDNLIINSTKLREVNLNIVLFQRDCGATTGFNTQISMINIGEEFPNESGNIFTADTGHGKVSGGRGGGPEVKVEVVYKIHIKISHHPDARGFNSQNQWENVRIEYDDL